MEGGEHPRALDAVLRTLQDAGGNYTGSEASPEEGFDLEVHVPGSVDRLFLEYKHSLAPIQFNTVAKRLLDAVPKGGHAGLVVRRLTLTLLDACKERGVCAFDLDGNAYVRLPGVFIERYRPAPSPQRVPSAGTCFTAKASRLVRALLTRPERYGMTQAELARETGLSRGYVSVLVSRLLNDGYMSNRVDLLCLDEPDRLLDDWVSHYRFDRHQQFHFALSMNTYEQGLQKLGGELGRMGGHYAFTGWSGAYLRAPYAEPPVLMAYVESVPESALLYPVKKQGNVMLLVPQDEGVFQFLTDSKLGPVACDPQVYVDLCRMPGRAREQADAFRHERLNFGRKLDGR